MTVHTCTMRVEKVCKVREEPAPRLAAERDALGSHCLECLAASASRDFWGFPEAQWGGTRGGGRMSTKAPLDAFARGSAAAISRRASLSFHLRAHATCAMEGREDDVRGMECELGCAEPACTAPPPTPSPTPQSGCIEALRSTVC